MATGIAATPVKSPASPADTEHLPTLISRLSEDVMDLVDTKISLLKVEVKEEANTFIRGGVSIAIGAVIATVGFVLVNVAVALFVATLLTNMNLSPAAQYALAFAITGAVYLALGGIVVLAMKSKLARQKLMPPMTLEEFRKDTQWLKKEL
jgi:uncharacterized membrane protein YqjE